MSAFDYVLLLLSFIFALALAHLLSRVGQLIVERHRVKFSGLLALAILNTVMLVYMNWLQLWDARHMAQWDLLTVTTLFIFSTLQYFVCATVAIEMPAEGQLDMDAYYWRQHGPYWLLMLLLVLSAIASNVVLIKANAEKFFQENLSNVPFLVVPLFALGVKARWAQWVAGFLLFVTIVATSIVFSAVLS